MKYQLLASELSGVSDRPDESTPFAHSIGVRLWVWSKNQKFPPPPPPSLPTLSRLQHLIHQCNKKILSMARQEQTKGVDDSL